MSELAAIRARIEAKQYAAALVDLEPRLRDRPDDTDALYMSAVCRRYRREFDVALALLARLKALAPETGRVHQEEGHAYRDSGRTDAALNAYMLACRYNPALDEWRNFEPWLDPLRDALGERVRRRFGIGAARADDTAVQG